MIGTLVALNLALTPPTRHNNDNLNDCLDAAIQRAYEDLRIHPSVRMTLTYSTGPGLDQHTTSVLAYWYQACPSEPARFELRESDITGGAAKAIRRIVGNAGNLAVYNSADNTYATTPYETGPDCSQGLTRNLQRLSDPATAPIVKLLDQVFGGGFPVFTPWLPGAYAEGDENLVSFGRGGGQLAATQLSFGMFPLKSITGFERSAAQINPFYTRWTLIIEHIPIGPSIGGADFGFTPPKNATRVSL